MVDHGPFNEPDLEKGLEDHGDDPTVWGLEHHADQPLPCDSACLRFC